MIHKSITYLFTAILLISGCHSQLKTNKMEINKIGTEAMNSVKRYSHEPTYYIGVSSSACSFQLLVNDMPLYSFYAKGGLPGTQFPINMYILQSGIQTVSIRVYPCKTAKKILAPFIEDNAVLNLSLSVTDWKNNTSMSTINDKLLILPLKEGKPVCSGLPYIEYSTTFNVTVPYKTKGWINGINLEKEDSDKVKMETIAVYEKIRALKANKDIVGELYFSKNTMSEYGQSLYRDEKYFKLYPDDCVQIYNNKTFYMDPLNQCVIKYYGNGKVVALERVDLYNRDEPAIIMKYTINEDEKMQSVQFLLYRPSKNAPLEQIR